MGLNLRVSFLFFKPAEEQQESKIATGKRSVKHRCIKSYKVQNHHDERSKRELMESLKVNRGCHIVICSPITEIKW